MNIYYLHKSKANAVWIQDDKWTHVQIPQTSATVAVLLCRTAYVVASSRQKARLYDGKTSDRIGRDGNRRWI